MATIQSIIDRVTDVTKDYDHVRWTLREIARWLNDAAGQIASIHPRSASRYVILTLREGARQDLRDIDPTIEWIRLHELTCNVTPEGNTSGNTIRQVSRPALDFAFRTWRRKQPTAAEVKEFAMDERHPFVFDVNPPVAAGTKVLALAAVRPEPFMKLNSAGTALEDPNEKFPLAAGYDIPAVDYVLSRCFGKDANDPTYATRAALHAQTFQATLGVEVSDTVGAS